MCGFGFWVGLLVSFLGLTVTCVVGFVVYGFWIGFWLAGLMFCLGCVLRVLGCACVLGAFCGFFPVV